MKFIILPEKDDFICRIIKTRAAKTIGCPCSSYISVYFSSASAIAAAARRPSPIARITVAPPRTMSPPA